jgi:hemolysin D
MKKRADNLRNEFLPAAMEIIETPASPLGWLTIWLIFALIIIAIIWSIVGIVDEVAVARGTVIPDGRVKVIQTPESGVILSLPVREGDHVEKGQLLVELDNTMVGIDVDASKESLSNLKIEKKVLEMELAGSSKFENIAVPETSRQFLMHISDLRRQSQSNLVRRTEQLQSVSTQAKSEIVYTETEISGLKKKQTFVQSELKNLKELSQSGAVANSELVSKQAELDVLNEQLRGLEVKLGKANEQYSQSQKSIADETKKYHEELMTLLVQKDKEILVAESQFDKANTLSNMNTIVAPVDGQINGLGTNAVGSVVSASNPIMTIVPNDIPLIIEAIVANQDIGFVHEGQAVDIKVDTFPFQKYGTIDGEITFVSPDAYQDEKLGSVYKIRVTPKQKGLKINDKLMNLSSGMTTTVEVKTGKRRIIEFFIPAIDYVKDSFELR